MLKLIHFYWRSRWERFYYKNRWHLLLDLGLLTILVILGISVVSLHFYQPNLSWLIGQSTTPIVDINNPPLKFEFSVASSSLKIAQGTIVKVRYENSGETVVNDAQLSFSSVDSSHRLLKLEKVVDGIEEVKVKANTLLLPPLKGKTSGELTLKAYFASRDEKVKNINWQVESTYNLAGQLFKETVALPELKVSSELNLSAVVYYNSPQGDQLGVGPLPPVVGLPTNYWVFVEAKSTGEFKDFVFSARLPQGVDLTGTRSLLAGDFNYNSASRQLIWKIPKLVEGEIASYRLGFEIQFIPTKKQVGDVASLVTNLNYYAQDVVTNEETSGSLEALNTNLDHDKINRGSGQVID